MDTQHDYLIAAPDLGDVFASDPAAVPSGAPYTRNLAHAKRYHSLADAERNLAPREHIVPIDDLAVMFGGGLIP